MTSKLAHLHLNPYCCPFELLVRISCKHLNEKWRKSFPQRKRLLCCIPKTIPKLHFSDNLNRMIFTLMSQAYLPPCFLPHSSSSYLHTEKIESLKCEKIHSTLVRHLVSLPTLASTFPKAKLGGGRLSSKSVTRGQLGTVLLACQGHDSMKDLATT